MGYCVASFRFRPECFHCWKSISILNYSNSTLSIWVIVWPASASGQSVFTVENQSLYWIILTLLCLYGLLCGQLQVQAGVFSLSCWMRSASCRQCKILLFSSWSSAADTCPCSFRPNSSRSCMNSPTGSRWPAGSFVMLASWKRKCMCLALPRPGPRSSIQVRGLRQRELGLICSFVWQMIKLVKKNHYYIKWKKWWLVSLIRL